MANYNVGDMIRLTRLSVGMSQEELCDNICSVQTLSRIENGKVSVKKEVYHGLMERMGRTGEKNYSVLSVEEYEVLDDMRKIGNLLYRREYEEAEELLRELKAKIDINDNLNQQYIEQVEGTIDYCLKRISNQLYIEILEKSLSYTVKDYKNYLDKVYPFSKREIQILKNVAHAYDDIGDRENAISINYMLLRSLSTGYMEQKTATQWILILINSTARMYGGMGEHEKAIRMCRNAIEKSKKHHFYSVMPTVYSEIAWNMMKQIEKNQRKQTDIHECKKMLRQGYAAAALTKQKSIGKIIQDYYLEKFGTAIYS